MNTLREYLNNYKNMTIELINNLYCDNMDSIDKFMNKRQDILNFIQKLDYTKKEINLIIDEIQLFDIEKRLKDVMTAKKEKLLVEMEKMTVSRNANNSYNKNLYGNARVFSKKI
jgi:hypothetical protein